MPIPALAVAPIDVVSSVTPPPNARLKSKRLVPSPSQRSLPYANDQMRVSEVKPVPGWFGLWSMTWISG